MFIFLGSFFKISFPPSSLLRFSQPHLILSHLRFTYRVWAHLILFHLCCRHIFSHLALPEHVISSFSRPRWGCTVEQLPQTGLRRRQLHAAWRHDHAAHRHGHPPHHHLVPRQRPAWRVWGAQASLLLLHGEFVPKVFYFSLTVISASLASASR